MTDYCKAIVDPDFRAALQNIFVSSAVMFQSYEKLLETFFPEPPCQKLTFKLPDSILPGLHLYEKFPRILALFTNKHMKFKSVCTVIENGDRSLDLPENFLPTLQLFNQICNSGVETPTHTRFKRGSFNRFFEYVFGDADERLRILESYSLHHLRMITF